MPSEHDLEPPSVSGSSFQYSLAFTPHGPITITSNADFASQGWPGSGTKADPYVIAGLNITATSTCIDVSHTDAYFVIRDCFLTSDISNNGVGISFDGVKNGLITGCHIRNGSYGVSFSSSSDNLIRNNTFTENGWAGVGLKSSSNNLIENNTFTANIWAGVSFSSSSNNLIENNTFTANGYAGVSLSSSSYNAVVANAISENGMYGVSFVFAPNNTIENNTITANVLIGVDLDSSSNCRINHTTFVNNGLVIDASSVDDWYQQISSDTTVNGKPLGYFWNLTSGTIDGSQYGQVILANCTGVRVENGQFNNVSVGIQLGFSSGTTIVNNTITANGWNGVSFSSSSNNTVKDCVIRSNTVNGMTFVSSSNNEIVNNTVSLSKYGVYLYYYSSNNEIVNNTVSMNEYGVYLSYLSANNTLWLNAFAWNNVSNGYDVNDDNHWNSTDIGNYWSDYNGTGVYHVSGKGGAIDYHPIQLVDTIAPSIDHPLDLQYAEGTSGHSITWHPEDKFPSSYKVYRNGTVVGFGTWDGSPITVDVDGLSVGSYNYTLVVYDSTGNQNSDTVFVTVTENTISSTMPPTISVTTFFIMGPSFILLAGLGILVVIVVIVLAKRRS
ncbi:MAG: right-handed parallel beta-helix repeat-containing protein [Candidatus Thorarchaeota archaeon]|nr:right-handed parallel beta-helix repeat-containing protein [Candidatus Thorarchaeota archaeon]